MKAIDYKDNGNGIYGEDGSIYAIGDVVGYKCNPTNPQLILGRILAIHNGYMIVDCSKEYTSDIKRVPVAWISEMKLISKSNKYKSL